MRADFALDYDVVTVERAEKLYLMARFESGAAPGDSRRRPLNISLVIDRSGSMAGDKIDYTRQAAQFLVQHLSAEDTLSIVLYNDKVETLIPPERISNKDALIQQIDRIRVRGTTNLSGGWLAGCAHVASYLANDRLNRVLLMTDGLANRGITDVNHLITLARQKREEGISTTTMGLGTDFNEDLLMEMANAGGGAYYFIESPEVAPVIFDEELTGLLNVVGQNLTIHLDPAHVVTSVRQLNAYPMTSDMNSWQFTLGDVFGNEVKTLMLELEIPVLRQAGEQQIATLRFEYDKITGNHTEHHIEEMPVMINVSADLQIERHANTEVEERVLLLKAAQAREEAVKAADNGNYTEASQKLRAVAQSIGELSTATPRLEEEQNALLKQAIQMEAGENRYTEYNRKTMATQAFYTRKDRHDDTVMLRLRENQRTSKTEQMPLRKSDILPPTPDSVPINQKQPSVEERETDIAPQPGVTPTYLEYKGVFYELKDKLIRLGRSVNNEIVIAERGVSRFHAQITREGNKLILTDLNSTNGTVVWGRTLEKPHFLSVGDDVYISDEKLNFHPSPPLKGNIVENPNADPEEHPTMPERPEYPEHTGRDNSTMD